MVRCSFFSAGLENSFERVSTMIGHVLFDTGDVVFAFGSFRFDAISLIILLVAE